MRTACALTTLAVVISLIVVEMRLGHFSVFYAARNPACTQSKLFTLEAPTRGGNQKFEKLVDKKIFDYLVTPDLPRFATWRDLLSWKDPTPCPAEAVQRKGLKTVKTVAAQARSKQQLIKLIGHHGSRVNAILCVSGSSVWRKLPFSRRVLQDGRWILETARQLRKKGDLPKSLQLWAVSNPNTEPEAHRLAGKIEAGAEFIITQPPLIREHFRIWWENITRNGLKEKIQVLVGIPMISSLANFYFWCSLCDIPSSVAKKILPPQYEYTAKFWFQWNLQLLKELYSYDIEGFHFMPLTKKCKQLTLDLIEQHPELCIN